MTVPVRDRTHLRVHLGITLPPDLAAWVRQRAELDGTTISAVVEKAILQRQAIERTRKP